MNVKKQKNLRLRRKFIFKLKGTTYKATPKKNHNKKMKSKSKSKIPNDFNNIKVMNSINKIEEDENVEFKAQNNQGLNSPFRITLDDEDNFTNISKCLSNHYRNHSPVMIFEPKLENSK